MLKEKRLKEQLGWMSIILALFFLAGYVNLPDHSSIDVPAVYRGLLILSVSSLGTINSVGIAPIILLSAVMLTFRFVLLALGMKEVYVSFDRHRRYLEAGLLVLFCIVLALCVSYAFRLDLGGQFPRSAFLIAIVSVLFGFMAYLLKENTGYGYELFIAVWVLLHLFSGSMNFTGTYTLGYIPNFLKMLSVGSIHVELLYTPVITFFALLFAFVFFLLLRKFIVRIGPDETVPSVVYTTYHSVLLGSFSANLLMVIMNIILPGQVILLSFDSLLFGVQNAFNASSIIPLVVYTGVYLFLCVLFSVFIKAEISGTSNIKSVGPSVLIVFFGSIIAALFSLLGVISTGPGLIVLTGLVFHMFQTDKRKGLYYTFLLIGLGILFFLINAFTLISG